METLRALSAAALLGIALPAAAAPTAADLAAAMRAARQSEGFEVRLRIAPAAAEGAHAVPLKLAVIGQFGAARQRLLLRGIAPDAVRDLRLVAERGADGAVRVATREGAGDPFAAVWGSGLVPWDMLAPWWDWPHQRLGGVDRVGGRECRLLTSRHDADGTPIREVVSCIDEEGGLSLRTQLYDGHHALVRSATVLATLRKESGRLAPKRILLSGAGAPLEAEAYSGDEHFEIAADAFDLSEGAAGR